MLPVAVTGLLTVTDVGTMLGACLAGVGIAQVMALGCEELLRRGDLVELFPDWPDETFPLHACHPSRHQQPPKVRALIEFCRELAASAPRQAGTSRPRLSRSPRLVPAPSACKRACKRADHEPCWHGCG